MKRQYASAFVFTIAVSLSSTGFGRLIKDWPYERLFKEADL